MFSGSNANGIGTMTNSTMLPADPMLGSQQSGLIPTVGSSGFNVDPNTYMKLAMGLNDPLQLAMQSRDNVDNTPSSPLIHAILAALTDYKANEMDVPQIQQLMAQIAPLKQMEAQRGGAQVLPGVVMGQ